MPILEKRLTKLEKVLAGSSGVQKRGFAGRNICRIAGDLGRLLWFYLGGSVVDCCVWGVLLEGYAAFVWGF